MPWTRWERYRTDFFPVRYLNAYNLGVGFKPESYSRLQGPYSTNESSTLIYRIEAATLTLRVGYGNDMKLLCQT